MNPPIVFIHGLFLTPRSWAAWENFFEWRGHAAISPAWPWHVGEPAAARARPPTGFDDLALETVVETVARVVEAQETAPVLIGHGVGGLVVQRLVAAGYGEAGVCLGSVPPNRLLGCEVGGFCALAARAEALPTKGLLELTPDEFQRDFANGLAREQAHEVYRKFVVPGSRRLARDCLGHASEVDLERPHAPLLFVAGDRDRMIPDALCEMNARAYRDPGSVADFRLFPGRGHFLLGEPGWEQIAEHVEHWLATHVRAEALT
jgi:pimeloyl-ACP methyl ester carboxylesterase